MTTATRAPKSRKPARKAQPRTVHLYNAEGSPKLLEMTIGAETFSYFLTVLFADYGAGFEVRKLLSDGGDIYHVHVEHGGRSTCDCKGGEHHGHCKHQEAIRALIAAGKLPGPVAEGKPAGVPAALPACNDFGDP